MNDLRGRPNPKHDSSARLRLDELEMLRGEVSRMVALASRDPRNLREAILRHLPHGIIVCDAEGTITVRNAAAERIWPAGANAARISDWNKCRAFYSDGRSYGPDDWSLARCLKRREVVPAEEVWVERTDGLRTLLLGSCAPLAGAAGESRGAILVFADIAEFHSLAAVERASRDQIAKLQAVTSALAEARLPSDVANVVVQEMSAVLRAGKAFVSVLSQDGKELCMLGHAGLKLSSTSRFARFSIDTDVPIARAFRTGQSVWISSREQYLREFPSMPASDEGDTVSVACAPLVVGGQTIGAIAFAFLESRVFDALERSLVEDLAKQAAVTLERARLFAEARRAEERFNLALEAGRMGAWEFELGTGQVMWTSTLEQLHGIPAAVYNPEDVEVDSVIICKP